MFYKEISTDESRKERELESLTIACCHVIVMPAKLSWGELLGEKFKAEICQTDSELLTGGLGHSWSHVGRAGL